MNSDISEIRSSLEPFGLDILGINEAQGRVLVGNSGSRFWKVFTQSMEFEDGDSDPLDRWSLRIGHQVATELGARVLFPFEGPPYQPFQDWARHSGRAFSSPTGILIHDSAGLWFGFRFALIFEGGQHTQDLPAWSESPCLSCLDQPCMKACPVNAFTENGYQVESCRTFLRTPVGNDCMAQGCAARRACPVADENHYSPEHAHFHMKAFRDA